MATTIKDTPLFLRASGKAAWAGVRWVQSGEVNEVT